MGREMAKRFSKASVVADLRKRAGVLQKHRRFDTENGTAQLRPVVFNEETLRLIDKAADYGRWRALLDLASEIEDGYIGTGA